MRPENPTAFPTQPLEHNHYWHAGESGMTLRDYFAAKAADAIFAKYGFDTPFCKEASPMPLIARYAYELADAMLAEREKSK